MNNGGKSLPFIFEALMIYLFTRLNNKTHNVSRVAVAQVKIRKVSVCGLTVIIGHKHPRKLSYSYRVLCDNQL